MRMGADYKSLQSLGLINQKRIICFFNGVIALAFF